MSNNQHTPSAAWLVERAITRREGMLASRGAFCVRTGKHTGRSPRDRFFVPGPEDEPLIGWGGTNVRMAPEVAQRLHAKVLDYLASQETFTIDGHACADPAWRLPVRVVADEAWLALLARAMFRDPGQGTFDENRGVTILAASRLLADPRTDGTASETFIVLDLPRRVVLVGGTAYAGEIKKGVFTWLNYFLPAAGVLPMHCSANIGPDERSALFFGLSGTGKTTLSADPERRLIGDDEHGWSDEGIFNFEGGCYAKCIGLSAKHEPQIHAALGFGCVLENVVVDPITRIPDFNDTSLTENTRAAYPLCHIPGVEPSGRGGHPDTVLFLACDAFGVLPPVARLNVEQAMYHFLSGYTARVAGTEEGVTRPEATFSVCFAAPFLPLPAGQYAELLAERLRRHRSSVWLVNTGWTGGGAGTGGRRMPLDATRAIVRAVLAGKLDSVPMTVDPFLGAMRPETCPGVSAEMMNPRRAWPDGNAYDEQARRLADLFARNFKPYQGQVSEAVRMAGPRGQAGRY